MDHVLPVLAPIRRPPYRGIATIFCAVFLGILAGGFARSTVACDTPVYRYAMYRWTPASYTVFYLHDTPTPDDVAAAHQQLIAATEDETQSLNIELIDVVGSKVVVAFRGMCAQCKMAEYTMKDVVEARLKEFVSDDLYVEELKD